MSVTRTLIVSVLAPVLMSGAAVFARVADVPARLHLPVAICDTEGVPDPIVAVAEQIAGDVYRDIGIAIEWTGEGCGDHEGRLAVKMTSRAKAEVDLPDETVGYAEPGASAAVVLYDRVRAVAHRQGIRRDVLLGYVMAHELGHLLLPPQSHSEGGVMRATLNVELAVARRLRFTPGQGALIVRKLEGARPPIVLATR